MTGWAYRSKAALRGSVAAILLVCAGAMAQAQSYTFSAVRIEGNQRIESATILTFAGIAQGQTVSAGELNDAAQRIRASGLFETVDVVPQGGTLVIVVTEFPTINRVSFEGNARLSDEDLAAVVESEPRRVFSPAQAEADVAAIARAYADAGRINAAIAPAIIRRDDNRVDLVFEIAEGGLSEVERVSFVGNRAFGERRLRGVLETKQAGILRNLINADTFVQDRIALDRQVLTDFYLSRGYADFTVQSVDVTLTRERDAYLITFNVQEGQQFTMGEVSVSSELPEADAAEFQNLLRVRTGDVYSPVAIENDISRIEALALRQGINFLRVEPRITRDDRNLRLNISYALVRGDRIFVERIDIEGNATTLDRVIRSQFRAVEGDPFNPRAIRESAERIRALGHFADVQVDAREGSAPDQVVIDVNVEEQPTGSLSFGANYSTDNDVSLLANYSEGNFLGRGQSLSLDLSTSQTNRVLAFSFGEPQFLDRDLRAGLDLSYRSTDNADALYDTATFRFTPSLRFPVSENGRLTTFFATEFTDITDVAGSDTPDDADDDASPVIEAEAAEGGVWTTALGYTYSFDNRRSGLNLNGGVQFRFGQEFGFGDSQFIKTTALASAETGILGEEVVLRATVEGGVLTYGNGNSRVTDRFFMGSRIMRGFEPGGIGPRDAVTDDALGGNIFAVARLEAEFPLGLPEEYGISGGAFVDYGSVWQVGETYGQDVLYDEFTPRTTVGLALFWDTPVGPLRFNFTEPVDVQEFDRPRAFEVTIQTNF
jgi:outer membrane protein insertion porin family